MNGESTGTEGMSLRLEGIKIIIAPKGIVMSPDTVQKFLKAEPKPAAPAPVVSAACGNLRESDMNLTVALRLGQLLADRGA